MATINVNEAKSHFSHYLQLVQQGKTFIICKRNIPIAEIRPLNRPTKKHLLGFAKGEGKILDSFFEPLSREELENWSGKRTK